MQDDAAPLVGPAPHLIAIATPAPALRTQDGLRKECQAMNALAEPIELLESECNAHSWYDPSAADEDEDEPVGDPACSARVLGWTVERICTCPTFRRNPDSAGS
jgi:hypothetical protein